MACVERKRTPEIVLAHCPVVLLRWLDIWENFDYCKAVEQLLSSWKPEEYSRLAQIRTGWALTASHWFKLSWCISDRVAFIDVVHINVFLERPLQQSPLRRRWFEGLRFDKLRKCNIFASGCSIIFTKLNLFSEVTFQVQLLIVPAMTIMKADETLIGEEVQLLETSQSTSLCIINPGADLRFPPF